MGNNAILSHRIFKKFAFVNNWILLFLACFVVRFPFFLSDNFNFDGDEAIIGIMAQDFLDGNSFPIYFFGQNYGFSTFEVLATAIFEFILGSSIWSLRLGALFLFSLGLTFVYQAFKIQKLSQKWSILLLLLFVTFPTWYLWGAMVRGGYLTAFVFCCLLYYLMVKPKRPLIFALIGISSAIVFESHVFILLGIVPLLVTWFLTIPQKFQATSIMALSFGIVIFLIRTVGYSNDTSWNSPEMNFGWVQLKYLTSQSQGIIAGFSNFFYYGMNVEHSLWWHILLILLLAMSVVYLIWVLLKGQLKHRKFVSIAIIATILIYVFLVSTMRMYSPRYWIGLFTGLLFWLVYFFSENRTKLLSKVTALTLTTISFVGISVGNQMKFDWYDAGVNEMKAFYEFHAEVKRLDAKAIYITDALIQWKWNYLFGKEIPAACFYNEERIPKYSRKIERIYAKTPEKVIIGGLYGMCFSMDELPQFNEYRYKVNDKYFVNPIARKDYLERARKVVND